MRTWVMWLLAGWMVAGWTAGGGAQGADKLTGAGATFPYPLYEKWFAAFEKRFPGTAIEYRAIGSGAGIEALAGNEVDFAGSDFPLSDEQLAALPRKVRMIPTVVGGVVPIFHLAGVLDDLRFTPEALAGIYLGKITRWNDPAIKAANRDVALPARNIVVVHRSDRSGTSFVWTDYLSKVSTDWKAAAGAGVTVKWPTGIAGEGNEGVAQLVARTPDSIGYVEFFYALQKRISYGSVRNSAGKYVQADLSTVPAAAADFAASIQNDFRVSITNAPGPNSYPIASLTFLLVPYELPDPSKQRTMQDFLLWMLSSGQKQCAALGYAALPARIAEKAQQVIEAH